MTEGSVWKMGLFKSCAEPLTGEQLELNLYQWKKREIAKDAYPADLPLLYFYHESQLRYQQTMVLRVLKLILDKHQPYFLSPNYQRDYDQIRSEDNITWIEQIDIS